MSFDRPAANRKFAEREGFPYRLLSDTERAMGLAYGACRSRKDPVPDRVTYVIGPGGRVEQAIRTQDPGGQAAELLESLPGAGESCGLDPTAS